MVAPLVILAFAAGSAMMAGGGWWAYEEGYFAGGSGPQLIAPELKPVTPEALYDLARKSPPIVTPVQAQVSVEAGKPVPLPPWYRPTDPDGDPLTEISVSLSGVGMLLVDGRQVPPAVTARIGMRDAGKLFYLPSLDGGTGTVTLAAASNSEGFGAGATVSFVAPAPPPPPPPPPPVVAMAPAVPPPPPRPMSVETYLRGQALARGGAVPLGQATQRNIRPQMPAPIVSAALTEPRLSDPDYGRHNLRKDETGLPVLRERMITADRYISAVTETPINSQLAGRVVLQVNQHVFGSDGRLILIPKGSRIVCLYESLAREGDTRLPVQCGRLIRPDGANLLLSDAMGADQAGSVGFTGEIDNRISERFGAAFFLSAVSALSAIAADGSDSEAAQQGTDALNENLSTAVERVIEQTLDLAPIMTVAQGSRVTLLPSNDIYLRKPE